MSNSDPLENTPPITRPTTETLVEAQERAERNWRVAKIFAKQLSDKLLTSFHAEIQQELKTLNGHCGEGNFEYKMRKRYELDLAKVIRICEEIKNNQIKE